MLFNRTFEEIERTVVLVVYKVLEVIFEGHSQFIPIVIFPDLKLRVFELLVKRLKGPLVYFPVLGAAYLILKIPRIITGLQVF